MNTDTIPEGFEDLLDYLKRSRGFEFNAYKTSSLVRRIEKRMQTAGIDSYTRYCDFLEAHPQEFTQLFNTILINVTSFFRDPPSWETIAHDVIPKILDARNGDTAIRVWSAGCSSGQEAYSLAMLFAEALGQTGFRDRIKIYATDVDEEALSQGRLATYSAEDVKAIPEHLVSRYFEHTNDRYVFDRDLRRSIIFGRHDLILDPPISRVALLACRNTLMYFNAEAQQRILDRFYFGLREGGFLFLGKAEMLLTRSSMFSPVDFKKRIFVKVTRQSFRNGVTMAVPRGDNGEDGSEAPDRLREVALQADPTAQIVVDNSRNLVLANDRARTLFGLTATDNGRMLQDLEISYRPTELRSMIEVACSERRAINTKDIEWTSPSGERVFLDIFVMPLVDAKAQMLGVEVLFRDVTRYRRLEDDLKNSHQELETANEELQSTNEELETTNEELQSTVEELETTNEELQSTNEELETMNEELQSTNEELQSANEQLRQSGDELNRANSFFENILGSFHDGLIVVDSEFRIQAWNNKSEDQWGLRSNEVQGKHLMSFDIGLPVDKLRQPLRRCLNGESPFERLNMSATNRRGRLVELVVSCAPFAVGDNPTWGAIVTIEDSSAPPSVASKL